MLLARPAARAGRITSPSSTPRADRSVTLTRASRILLALTVLVVLTIVFWPTPVDRPVAGQVTQAVEVAQQAGATAVTYNRIEITANVLMFVPLGALGVLAFPRLRWWMVPLTALALSGTIELAQLLLIEQRFASPIDVAANTAGALIGAAAVAAIRTQVSR